MIVGMAKNLTPRRSAKPQCSVSQRFLSQSAYSLLKNFHLTTTGTGNQSKEDNSLMQKRQSDLTYSGNETRKIAKNVANRAVSEAPGRWHGPCNMKTRKLEA